jgi:3-deoxy-D-manno-octulosonic-acid transferase
MGELARFYRLARVAFVGGTLVPVGGHNLMEPALAGVPVVFGPHTANVRAVAIGLMRAGGGFPVSSPVALAGRIAGLLAAPASARRAGTRARAYVMGLKGVSRRVARMVLKEGLK